MAKKKQQYPNRKRNMVIGLAITLAVIAFASVGFGAYYVWDRNEKSYIGTIGGEKVPTGLYRLNLLEQQLQIENQYGWEIWYYGLGEIPMMDMAKGQAYDSTMATMLSAIKAREYGADTLTPDQIDDVEYAIEMFPIWYGDDGMKYIGLSEQELREALRASFYASNLYTMVTDDLFVFDEAAFEQAFEEYFAAEAQMLRRYEFYYILSYDMDRIIDAQFKLDEGADFYSVMAEYSVSYMPPPEGSANANSISDADVNDDVAEDEDEIEEDDEMEAAAEESAEGDIDVDEDIDEDETEDSDDEVIWDFDDDDEIPDFDVEALGDMDDFEYVFDLSDLVVDMNLITLYGHEMTGDISDSIFNMQPGEVSDIVPLMDETGLNMEAFVIFKLLNVTEPVYDQEKEFYRDSVFIPDRKNELFTPLLSSWNEEIDIVMNVRAYNAVNLFGFE